MVSSRLFQLPLVIQSQTICRRLRNSSNEIRTQKCQRRGGVAIVFRSVRQAQNMQKPPKMGSSCKTASIGHLGYFPGTYKGILRAENAPKNSKQGTLTRISGNGLFLVFSGSAPVRRHQEFFRRFRRNYCLFIGRKG